MSNLVYPSLPGLAWEVRRTPTWSVVVRTTPTQREFRYTNQLYPRRRRTLQYDVLRAEPSLAELQALEGFFNRHRSALESFLLDDPDDRSVTGQQFGVTDGVSKSFQLVRDWGGFVEPIYELASAPTVYLAGVATSALTISRGLITFNVTPAAGQVLTWSGSYLWRVRFAETSLDFSKFLDRLWKTGKVELIDVPLES